MIHRLIETAESSGDSLLHQNIARSIPSATTTTTIKMSKDSSVTNLHMHHPRLADLFEDFTRPHTSTTGASSGAQTTQTHYNAQTNSTTVTYGSGSSPTNIPSFLPVEEIYVLPQFQPPNPEDEDDVVPDQHAAFGITRAMERRREAAWRDLGLEGVVRGDTGLAAKGKATGKATGARGGRVTCLR